MASLTRALSTHPTFTLVALSLVARLFTTTLLLTWSSLLPSFDSSSSVLLSSPTSAATPFLRWDTVYFAEVALRGYTQEQQLAFQSGLPALMRVGGEVLAWFEGSKVDESKVVFGGMVFAAFATAGAVASLYHLTLSLAPQQRTYALVTSVFFLLAPSPPTLHSVPYTEPFAACCTLTGMLLFSRRRHTLASLVWAFGTTFRAQGIVLGIGFFGWRYLLERPRLRSGKWEVKTMLKGFVPFAVLSAISAAPFVVFQAWVYASFCRVGTRPWCEVGLGSSYGWIQSEYWDVGPFRYWTLQQLPNFLLAAPLLALSVAASFTFYSRNYAIVLRQTLPFLPLAPAPSTSSTSPFLYPSLTPFIHLHTFLTCLLFFASHVQIILRVTVTNPVPFWFLAHLFSSPATWKWTRRWTYYTVGWGVLATCLWAAFLPPA